MIEIKNLRKAYNSSEILKDINLTIDKDLIVAFIGKSGCGKTTLLNLLSGLIHVSSGEIESSFKQVSYLTQKPVLLSYRNGFENAILGSELRNDIIGDSKNDVPKLFDLFDLKDALNKFPKELSGGMKQRIGIIQTMLINAELYLLDEPFNAIDRNALLKIEKYIWETLKGKRASGIIVTHDIEQALLMSDRIIMLSSNPGTIVFDKKYPEEYCKIAPSERKEYPQFNNYLIEVVKEFSKL